MMNISEMQYPIKENLKKYFGYDDFNERSSDGIETKWGGGSLY